MACEQCSHQHEIMYSIHIPGKSLSFSQYVWGTRLAHASVSVERPRPDKFRKLLITICLVSMITFILLLISDSQYQFVLYVWNINDDAGDYLFRLHNAEVIAIFLVCYIVGVLTIRLSLLWRQRRWLHKTYESSDIIRNGYYLQLTEKGLLWNDGSNKCVQSFLTWNKVRGIKNHENMDYIDLGIQGFLWIAVESEAFKRREVIAFIQERVARQYH